MPENALGNWFLRAFHFFQPKGVRYDPAENATEALYTLAEIHLVIPQPNSKKRKKHGGIMYSLHDLGWNEAWESTFQPYKDKGFIPARISKEMKNIYNVISEQGEVKAKLSDLLWIAAKNRGMLPAIGDWVALQQKQSGDPYLIMEILPRSSCFSRKAKNTFGRNCGYRFFDSSLRCRLQAA